MRGRGFTWFLICVLTFCTNSMSCDDDSSGGAGTDGAGDTGSADSNDDAGEDPVDDLADRGPQLPTFDLEEFCPRIAEAVCGRPGCHVAFNGCEPEFVEQTCAASLGTVQAAVDAGRRTYDREAARDCVSALAEVNCFDSDAIQRLRTGVCNEALAGAAGLGDECYDFRDCAEGHCLGFLEGECPGVCEPFQGLGEPCGTPDAACDPDTSWCARGVECEALAGEGDDCEIGFQCQAGMACLGGRCTADLGDEGESCTPQPDRPQCRSGLACTPNFVTQATVCASAPDLSAGDACFSALACPLEEGLGCAWDGVSAEGGVCVPLPGVGDDCTEVNFCESGAYCDFFVTGTCRPIKTAGEPCEAVMAEECLSSWCTDEAGIPCSSGDDSCTCDTGSAFFENADAIDWWPTVGPIRICGGVATP